MRRHKIIFTLAVTLIVFSACRITAQSDVPLLHMGFEEGFAIEGTSPGVKATIAGEPVGPVCFVKGIMGKAFRYPDAKNCVVWQGPLLNNAEGTFSFWANLEGWQPAFNGPSFFRFFLPGSEMLFYRIYGQLAVYESSGPQMTQAEDHFLENGRWRMYTYVYKQGYRCLYVDDVPVCENKNARNDFGALAKGEKYSAYLQTYYNPSVIYDEITTWEKPFTQGEVAALFYARRSRPKGVDSSLVVPLAGKAPGDSSDSEWDHATQINLGYNSFTGTRLTSGDSAQVLHKDRTLYLLYRMPLPKDYIAEKTKSGGSLFRADARERDGNVFADDCVFVDLSPDGGQTNYRLAVNASGVLYDDRNGEKSFNHSFTANVEEANGYWTVKMTIPLAGLGSPADEKWSFNATRVVQKTGLAKRQAFFTRGALISHGSLQLSEDQNTGTKVSPQWNTSTGTLSLRVEATLSKSISVDLELQPLDHRTVFPEDKSVNLYREKYPLAQPVTISKILYPVEGRIKDDVSLALKDGSVALCSVVLKDTTGKVLYSNSGLVSVEEGGNLQMKYIPTKRKLYAEVTLPSSTLLTHKVSAELGLYRVGLVDVIARKKIDAFTKVSQETDFDLSDQPPGDYEILATIVVDGQRTTTLKGALSKQEDPPWIGNKLGDMKRVPKPWTPIILKASNVSVWGRTYEFNRAFLPTQLTCLNEDLLTAPIRLTAEVNGQPVVLSASQIAISPADNAGMKVVLKGRGSLGVLSAELLGWIEFDGFSCTRITFRTSGKKPITINNVTLEIPMRKEVATLYDISGYEPINIKAGSIPKEGVQAWAGTGQRVGNAERGIQWTWPSSPETLKPGTYSLFITPQDNQVLVKLILANRPEEIMSSKFYEFGLQGLPIRPFPKDLRNYILGAAPIYEMPQEDREAMIAWKRPAVSLYTEGWSGKWNYLHLSKKWQESARANYKEYFNRTGQFPALYLNIVLTDGNTPEYLYYRNEWRPLPDNTPSVTFVSPTKLMKDYDGHDGKVEPSGAGVCITAKSYREFYYYYLDQVLTALQSVPDASPFWVYFDNSSLIGCGNPYHGCDTHQSDDLYHQLVYRDFLKHVYEIVHAHDPRNRVTIHNSGARYASIYAFCDVFIEGEQFTAHWSQQMSNNPKLTQNDCYPTVLSLDKVRAQFNPRCWGPQHLFLSQFWNDESQKESEYRKSHPGKTAPSMERRYRYISGLMRVHDTPLWGELTPMLPTYTHMVRWGWNDALEFIPYWNTKGAFDFSPGDAEKVAVSAWYGPDGRLTMGAFNGGKESMTITITLHPNQFPVKLKHFTHASDMTSPDPVLDLGKTTMDSFPLVGDVLSVVVGPEDYRLLRFDE